MATPSTRQRIRQMATYQRVHQHNVVMVRIVLVNIEVARVLATVVLPRGISKKILLI
jgi:hypothetical protein